MDDLALFKKAEYKKKLGKLNEAKSIYLKILRKSPNNISALALLGTLYAQQNNMAEAVRLLEKAVRIKADNPGLLNNLGNAYKATGDFERARQCYVQALRLDPHYSRAHHGLGTIYCDFLKDREQALACFQEALANDPGLAEAHFSYGAILVDSKDQRGLMHLEQASRINPHLEGLQRKLGIGYFKFNRRDEAVTLLTRALQKNPGDTVAEYYLSLAQGKKPDSRLREKYVEELFDTYSQGFEKELTERLGYRIPAKAREMLEELFGNTLQFTNMADLGCGTGLGGLVFRNCAQRLVGIDLSEKMLREAARKNMYDELMQGEVIQVLDKYNTAFDFFLSADMIVYFQEVKDLFQSIARKAMPGALLIFSTEHHETDGDFVIRKSGRTAHNPEYIRRVTGTLNIQIISELRLPLRKEAEAWIEGDLYLCRLPEQ